MKRAKKRYIRNEGSSGKIRRTATHSVRDWEQRRLRRQGDGDKNGERRTEGETGKRASRGKRHTQARFFTTCTPPPNATSPCSKSVGTDSGNGCSGRQCSLYTLSVLRLSPSLSLCICTHVILSYRLSIFACCVSVWSRLVLHPLQNLPLTATSPRSDGP